MSDNAVTILIVDDDVETVKIFSYYLNKQGFSTLMASNVPEALTHMETTIPDIVLLDLMLPGQNGEELLKHIRQDAQLASVYVIIVSAHPLDSRKLPTGIVPDDVLRKPVRIPQLQQVLGKALA